MNVKSTQPNNCRHLTSSITWSYYIQPPYTPTPVYSVHYGFRSDWYPVDDVSGRYQDWYQSGIRSIWWIVRLIQTELSDRIRTDIRSAEIRLAIRPISPDESSAWFHLFDQASSEYISRHQTDSDLQLKPVWFVRVIQYDALSDEYSLTSVSLIRSDESSGSFLVDASDRFGTRCHQPDSCLMLSSLLIGLIL